ncbi:benzaldehyde dehydrogenase [Arthrobacter ginkgonis]|uniref:Benzaldehyde dehydrogenase n=1 Tax=Arthrobacter ginkgonis TaxID=1630594 RepID=A0ABP7BPS1_9MICC
MSFLDPALWSGKVHTGTWTAGAAGTLAVRESATGEVLGEIGVASGDQARAAAATAAAAQRGWAALKPAERAAVLRRAAALFEEHAAEIEDWIVRESGGTRTKARTEIAAAIAECHEAAALPTHPHGEVLTSNKDRWSIARRRPAGVVTVIAPFNFPLTLSIRSVAPALGLGNAVLLKPDPRTSVSGGVVLQRVFDAAGLPAGVLQTLPGGADVGEAVVAAPEVRIISFTGSTPAGRRVGEAAARHLKRAHLELGGNNAIVVLPGADVQRAASAGAFGSFLHQGQICMAAGRHLVHESLHDEYVAALAAKADALRVGDPFREDVQLGPIIDERQLKNIDGIVQDTVLAGAEVAAGGTHDGPFYRPTVLTGIRRGMRAWEEEIFGPVAPVLAFSDVAEAAELVNASEFGLSVGILGEVGAAMGLADLIGTGKVHINEQTVSDEANAPFGGTGASGTGSRFGGAAANLEAFTETQWVTLRPEIEQYPF